MYLNIPPLGRAWVGFLFLQFIIYRTVGILFNLREHAGINIFTLELQGLELLLQRLEDDKQSRHDKYLTQRTYQHTTYGSGT